MYSKYCKKKSFLLSLIKKTEKQNIQGGHTLILKYRLLYCTYTENTVFTTFGYIFYIIYFIYVYIYRYLAREHKC